MDGPTAIVARTLAYAPGAAPRPSQGGVKVQIRMTPEIKDLIEEAARAGDEPCAGFIREAAIRRALEVLDAAAA